MRPFQGHHPGLFVNRLKEIMLLIGIITILLMVGAFLYFLKKSAYKE